MDWRQAGNNSTSEPEKCTSWTLGKIVKVLNSFIHLISAAHNLQEEGENINDVCVDLEGSIDVFLGADGMLPVAQDQLGIIGKKL